MTPEAIHFGTTFQHLLKQILVADTALGPVFMSKVDLSDAYMRVWVRLEDVPTLTFVVLWHPCDTEPLIGMHLSLPMGYVESVPAFCCETEMVTDLANVMMGW